MLDDPPVSPTKNWPYIFFIMKFNCSIDEIYKIIKEHIEKEYNITCIRADEVKSSGFDINEKIQKLIERAEVIIADISEDSPNVYYEIGYAIGINKRPIIIVDSKKRKQIPVGIQGLEVLTYNNSLADQDSLIRLLNLQLNLRRFRKT